ncbi:hypothetical protein DM02DRAFT_79388 [Periconia macrospinosa]|uniref:Uncharacterized protein n=1 Tax=Periconia macrospinosa TaxID=97972 RepID=A0A2V1DI82_9PLEO|nr:hypothetical protein DM02DRAFT_79388 [Periconia macrospinosa]
MADEGLPDSPPFLSPQLRLRRLVFLDSAPASPEAIDQTFAPIRQLHGHVHELTHQFSDILRDVGAVPRFSGRSRRTRQPRHNVSNFRLIIPDERIQQPGHFQRNRIFASPFPLHPPPPPGHESWPRPLPEPIVKVATALPKVSYKENQDEYRTLDYIQAQLKVLGHLKNTPADNLTAPMAASFIRRIKPDDGTPTALQALQLCYYMRSLGFDTYALWDQAWGELKFYVAASLTNPLDLLFWVCTFEPSKDPNGLLYRKTRRRARS